LKGIPAMAQPVLPSPSNFVAVALVINRSRDGPSFVFHYPPQVLPVHTTAQPQDLHAEDPFDSGDILLERLSQPEPLDASSASLPNSPHIQSWNRDDHLVTESGSQVVPWEHVAGFPTRDLASILTPARPYHKKLFQVSLDPLLCISYPIYVPETGVWKKKKKPHKAHASKPAEDQAAVTGDGEPGWKNGEASQKQDPPQQPQPALPSEKKEDGKNNGEEADDKRASMTMFNLVFILNPKKHEAKELVNTLYINIIKKVNKAYKYSQQHSDFVWKEAKRISALKDKGREESTSPTILGLKILFLAWI
jgi:nitrogen permease regulator 3-like protein